MAGEKFGEAENETAPQKPEEVTKRTIRVDTWRKLKKERSCPFRMPIFNKIPNFNGSDKAAALLAETDDFQKAKHVKVSIAQENVKLEVLKAGKSLYVPPQRNSAALFAKVSCTEGDDKAQQLKVARMQGPPESIEEIGFDTKQKLDMVVIGSVAVSRDGQRLGKGNGFVDLDLGILIHLGVITKDTLIVTTVHDLQVYDTLPSELFQSYDIPVDLIVTPTEVIRVAKRLPRPVGIEWNLLSERRIEIVPVLKLIKEKEEQSGKLITLKAEDTDVETKRKASKPRVRRQVRRRRRTGGENDDEDGNPESERNGNGDEDGDRPQRRRRRFGRRRRSQKSQSDADGDQSNKENTQGEKSNGEGGEGGRRRNRRGDRDRGDRDRRRPKRDDVCIKISDIARSVRIKDLKNELRTRGCNPMFIRWKAHQGRCFLHFPKKPSEEEEIVGKNLLDQLANLTVTVERDDNVDGAGEVTAAAAGEYPKEIKLRCDFLPKKQQNSDTEQQVQKNRIETTDEKTAV